MGALPVQVFGSQVLGKPGWLVSVSSEMAISLATGLNQALSEMNGCWLGYGEAGSLALRNDAPIWGIDRLPGYRPDQLRYANSPKPERASPSDRFLARLALPAESQRPQQQAPLEFDGEFVGAIVRADKVSNTDRRLAYAYINQSALEIGNQMTVHHLDDRIEATVID